MTTRKRRLAMTGGGAAIAAILLWSFIPAGTPPGSPSIALPSAATSSPAPATSIEATTPTTAAPTPASVPSPASTVSRRAYALGLHEIAGLSPDAVAGTHLELWVTWEPPVTKRVQVQLLLKDVVVERMIPPSLPEGPTTVLLSVPVRGVSDLLYGDRFGELSAVTRG